MVQALIAASGLASSRQPSVPTMLSENQKRLLLEAYRLSELSLGVQAQFAVASDQRSLVLSGVSVALAGLVAGLAGSGSEHFWSLGSASMFFLSAFFAVVAALPQKMITQGSKYGRLRKLIDKDSDFDSVIAGLAEENDEAILVNESRALVRSHAYKMAVLFFAAAACLALISFNSILAAQQASK